MTAQFLTFPCKNVTNNFNLLNYAAVRKKSGKQKCQSSLRVTIADTQGQRADTIRLSAFPFQLLAPRSLNWNRVQTKNALDARDDKCSRSRSHTLYPSLSVQRMQQHNWASIMRKIDQSKFEMRRILGATTRRCVTCCCHMPRVSSRVYCATR